jgi:N utilization substance protein B
VGARTTAREAALQMLFAIDASGNDVDQAISDFWRELPGDAEGREYADELVRGVRAKAEQLDERIRAASQNWRLERMARIDRNALRLGTYELLTRTDVPRAVILDEAVELAKRFGGEESSKFVNGVLDRIADDLGRTDGDENRAS